MKYSDDFNNYLYHSFEKNYVLIYTNFFDFYWFLNFWFRASPEKRMDPPVLMLLINGNVEYVRSSNEGVDFEGNFYKGFCKRISNISIKK